jgi:hypothetical protein
MYKYANNDFVAFEKLSNNNFYISLGFVPKNRDGKRSIQPQPPVTSPPQFSIKH